MEILEFVKKKGGILEEYHAKGSEKSGIHQMPSSQMLTNSYPPKSYSLIGRDSFFKKNEKKEKGRDNKKKKDNFLIS